jgi:hypothetical protein
MILCTQESSRQVWIGQFLRFLMRPRPWLTQTLQQAVKLSMVSPAPDGHGDRLSWSTFPTSFLSMHVRFGMKAVEVEHRLVAARGSKGQSLNVCMYVW